MCKEAAHSQENRINRLQFESVHGSISSESDSEEDVSQYYTSNPHLQIYDDDLHDENEESGEEIEGTYSEGDDLDDSDIIFGPFNTIDGNVEEGSDCESNEDDDCDDCDSEHGESECSCDEHTAERERDRETARLMAEQTLNVNRNADGSIVTTLGWPWNALLEINQCHTDFNSEQRDRKRVKYNAYSEQVGR